MRRLLSFLLPLVALLRGVPPGAAATTNDPSIATLPSPAPASPDAAALLRTGAKSLNGVGLARFTDIFTPLRCDQASLSPDGKQLAFSWYDGRELSVGVVELANPKVVKVKVVVASDPAEARRNTRPGEHPRPKVRFLRWVSATRVAVQTNTRAVFGVGLHQAEMRGVWFAFDADGANARVLFDPRDITVAVGGPRSVLVVPAYLSPIDVDPDLNDGILLQRSEWDRSDRRNPVVEHFWYRVDARTGHVSEIPAKKRAAAEAAIEARRRRFADELRAATGELAEVLPNKSVDLIECDETGQRFLACVQGGADAGGFHVYDRPTAKSYEYLRRATHLDTARIVGSVPFEFPVDDAPPLRGVLTLPRQARLRPFPAIVICPQKANDKYLTSFRPEILAFADMGLAVIQLEGAAARVTDRAAIGRITPAHEVARVVAAIDALAAKHPVSQKRVVLYGENQGGLLALRALQRHPDRFRAAIAAHLPIGRGQWRGDPLLRPLKVDPRPIQLLSYPGTDRWTSEFREARRLAGALRRGGGFVELRELTADDLTAVPAARAATFREIELFINASIYDYTVELGDLVEVAD